jgi:pimeloyl-ACP methyl ester carboxylesterase
MRLRSLLAAVVACAGAAAAAAPPAAAAIAWAPCAPVGFQCASLTVPLDPSGATPGAVTLAVSRAAATTNPTRSAVVALAGGPGQAALPFRPRLAANVGPALAARDLVVFDQRGTGRSGALRCPRVPRSIGGVRACAEALGPARGFYRTAETVEDIEAIRREGGYERLVLYGTSYGTRVAAAYAARYPARVEALLLDSVALPDGPDVFQRSSLRATGRVVRELCAAGRCRGITGDPRGDLAALARRLRDRRLRGPVTTPAGRTARASLDELDLYAVIAAGDLDPTLRADLPAAIRSALHGDARPILRLEARAFTAPEPGREIDEALFVTTRCEESVLPWGRSVASARERARLAQRAARTIPRAQLGPFDQITALLGDVVPLCLGWPHASPPPAPPGPLPPVPALLVAGAADVRTPVADARALAARIPGAVVLEVPAVGHSVLRSDSSGCARAAVAAFFTGRPVQPCAPAAPRFAPTPVAPVRLAQLPGAGRARETVAAAGATLDDVIRLFAAREVARDAPPRVGDRVGGLRAGTARWTRTGISLRRVEYVPGVVVGGFAPRAAGTTARLTVTGPAAPHGTVRLLAGGRAVAVLDGRRVATRVRRRPPPRTRPPRAAQGFSLSAAVVGRR